MSIYKGTTLLAGGPVTVPLFTPTWQDHLVNDISWLRADTFSWQSGTIYTLAYQHLVSDIAGITAQTETIAGVTITFYRAGDGHKIVLANQESNVGSIFSATGVAWYYILDTTNTRFKLPRTQWNFVGYRNGLGNLVSESLPNITGYIDFTDRAPYNGLTDIPNNSAIYQDTSKTRLTYASNDLSKQTPYSVNFDASRSSSTYQNNAPVQQRATEMYLYFYIGQFTQTAIQQTAGINSEVLNSKVDPSEVASLCMPDYESCIAGGSINAGTWIQTPKDSQVVVWGTDPYTEEYNSYVSPNSGQTQYQVGYRFDDQNGYTQGTSFCFLVPKNWYFTCNVEQGFHYRIYPLKGAN